MKDLYHGWMISTPGMGQLLQTTYMCNLMGKDHDHGPSFNPQFLSRLQMVFRVLYCSWTTLSVQIVAKYLDLTWRSLIDGLITFVSAVFKCLCFPCPVTYSYCVCKTVVHACVCVCATYIQCNHDEFMLRKIGV